MSLMVIIGGVVVTPAKFDVPAPVVKNAGCSESRLYMPFCCSHVTEGAMGAEVVAACCSEVGGATL